MNFKELLNLGLNEKEAKIYLASLELGKSAVQKIAEKAEVKRATTYVIIESLMQKGLMSSLTQGKKQFFFAEAPEKLSILFKGEELELKRKKDYLEKLMPELRAINSLHADKPTVRYFEGKEGMRAMTEEFFVSRHKEPARMFYSYDLLSEVFSTEEKKELQKKRQKTGTKVKSIINDEQNRILPSEDAVRVKIPSKKYPITSDIAIFGNKIRIATQKGKLAGLIIENKEISDTLKTLFDLAWKYAQEIKKKK